MNTSDVGTGEGEPLSREVAEAAANWLLRQRGAAADPVGLQAWLAEHPEHRRAWKRIEQLGLNLRSMPAGVAMAALDRPHSTARRRALQQLTVLVTAGAAGYVALRYQPWSTATVDERTVKGERRETTLPDGSSLHINTASALDIYFDERQRRIHLREGEILVRTAPDATSFARPFEVDTAQGRVRALGTRFTVRQDSESTLVTVHEHAVEITFANRTPYRLDAGHSVRFESTRIHDPTTADPNSHAWTRGLLYADRMPLERLTKELSRYRRGILRCDPAVADLQVSGAFPLTRTDDALALLADTLPVRVQRRFDGWITLVVGPGR